jgi:hydrogenase maturation factor HypF (carbamoyltransferase family)
MGRDPAMDKRALALRAPASEQKVTTCLEGPKCPFCGEVTPHKDDVKWFFDYKSCPRCGRNYLVRKRDSDATYETKEQIDPLELGEP